MTDYIENDHPRTQDGKFAQKNVAEPAAGFASLPTGDAPSTPTEFFDGLEGSGFGYLGERRNLRLDARETGVDVEAQIEHADAVVMAAARDAEMSDDELATWADSKRGRWAGEALFYGNGTDDPHLRGYLPQPKPDSAAERLVKARAGAAAAQKAVRDAELALQTARRLERGARYSLALADMEVHGLTPCDGPYPSYATRNFGPLTVYRFYDADGKPENTSLTMDELPGLSGYDLEDGLKSTLQEAGRADLLDRATFDSEAGMMCAYGEPADLTEIAEIVSQDTRFSTWG